MILRRITHLNNGGAKSTPITIPADSWLESIDWAASFLTNSYTSSQIVWAEVSTNSLATLDVNDATGPLSSIRSIFNGVAATTNVAWDWNINKFVAFPSGIFIPAQTQLWLHSSIGAFCNARIDVTVCFSDSTDRQAGSLRRNRGHVATLTPAGPGSIPDLPPEERPVPLPMRPVPVDPLPYEQFPLNSDQLRKAFRSRVLTVEMAMDEYLYIFGQWFDEVLIPLQLSMWGAFQIGADRTAIGYAEPVYDGWFMVSKPYQWSNNTPWAFMPFSEFETLWFNLLAGQTPFQFWVNNLQGGQPFNRANRPPVGNLSLPSGPYPFFNGANSLTFQMSLGAWFYDNALHQDSPKVNERLAKRSHRARFNMARYPKRTFA